MSVYLCRRVKKNGADGIVTEYANKLLAQPKTALATDSSIAMNQFGTYVRKYQWQGEETMMRQYFSALLKMDFDRFFHKSLFLNDGQDAQGQMSLFDLFGDEITPQPKDRGKRAFTDKVAWWLKDGAMVMFEEQLVNLQMRKSSRYADVAVDFVPMADIEAAKERANDYFTIRETYLELSGKEREEEQEHPELRERLNALYDKFVAQWGFFHDNDNKEFIMLDSLGVEVFTIEIQSGGTISKADIMREPVAFYMIDAMTVLSPM